MSQLAQVEQPVEPQVEQQQVEQQEEHLSSQEMPGELLEKEVTEGNATSEKRIELATRQIFSSSTQEDESLTIINSSNIVIDQSKKANKVAKEEKDAKKLIREQNKVLREEKKAVREEKKAVREQNKALREEKKAVREEKKLFNRTAKEARIEARMEAMTPEKKTIFLKKQEDRKVFMALPKEERKAIRANDRASCAFRASHPSSPSNLAKTNTTSSKDSSKETFKDERKVQRELRKAERMAKKARWDFLANNWSKPGSYPKNMDLLIIDGNNMRGGGPKRLSRNKVIEIVSSSLSNMNLDDARVIVTFDHEATKYEAPECFEILFSKDEIADDLIVRLVETEIKAKQDINVLVVTCDRGLALRILDLGKQVMRNKDFLGTFSSLLSH